MNNRFLYTIYLIFLISIASSIYFLKLWTSNFTPRMYFYHQNINLISSTDLTQRYLFVSEENYLGIISIELIEPLDYPVSELWFRIKEEGTEDWFVENHYESGSFVADGPLLFGLPVQSDSKDKKYLFEIQIACYQNEGCKLETIKDSILVRHYFDKQFFLSKPLEAFQLILKKVYQNFLQQPINQRLLVFILPLAIYGATILWLRSKYSRTIKNILIQKIQLFDKKDLLILSSVFLDAMIQIQLIFWLLLFCNIYYLKKEKSSKILDFSLYISAFLYVSSLIFSLVDFSYAANRIALWSFTYLCIATVYISLRIVVKTWNKNLNHS